LGSVVCQASCEPPRTRELGVEKLGNEGQAI